MLERVRIGGGIVVYRSPLLAEAGVCHAFSARHGGVSPPPFDSLNLATASAVSPVAAAPGSESCPASRDDDPANGPRNYAALQKTLGCESADICWVRQVHAAGVFVVNESNFPEHPQADAIATATPGLLLTIRVADCVPILLADRFGRFVAAVHAGWRGVVADVIGATIEQITRRWELPATSLVAAIGPCIGLDHFEVGPEVAAAFGLAGLKDAVDERRWPKPHINLAEAVASQLRHHGLSASSIDRTDRCTFRDADDFYSHRRDRGVTGRMAAVIATSGLLT